MPRPTHFLLFLLLTSAASQATAQVTDQAPRLKGRVLDAKTRLPVPYASLSLRNDSHWTLADTKGHFELAVPQKSAPDSLLLECPGYLPRPVVLHNRALADTTLTLEKIATTPKVQPVNPAPATVQRLGALAKKPGEGMIMGLMGSQYALLMQPSPKLKLGAIRTVSFFVGENGVPKEPFRIRIYRADGPNHSPGTNLLTESIVVKAPGGGQWFTVDITNYIVEAPREGFFVAMEWLVDAGTTGHGFLQSDGFTIPSQVLRPTFEFKDSKTWSFTVGKGWDLLTLKTQDAKFYNAMIRAEVEELK